MGLTTVARRTCRLCVALDVESPASLVIPSSLNHGYQLRDDLSPIVPGHMLLISQNHNSERDSGKAFEAGKRVGKILESLRSQIEATGKVAIFFEHMPGKMTDRGGANCIDHPHVHICPIDVDLSAASLKRFWLFSAAGASIWRRAPDLATVYLTAYHHSCLWLLDSRGEIHVSLLPNRPVPSQLLRQWLADMVSASSWDWREIASPGPS